MAPRHNLKHSKINDYFLTQERELTDDEQQYHINAYDYECDYRMKRCSRCVVVEFNLRFNTQIYRVKLKTREKNIKQFYIIKVIKFNYIATLYSCKRATTLTKANYVHLKMVRDSINIKTEDWTNVFIDVAKCLQCCK